MITDVTDGGRCFTNGDQFLPKCTKESNIANHQKVGTIDEKSEKWNKNYLATLL
jgi:hypothetical protein